MSLRLLVVLAFSALAAASIAHAANWPQPIEGDYTIKDFKFASGETLPELKIHYRTLGSIHKDKNGHVDNAVLIMHGTGGTGTQFLQDRFAGELFGAGQPLDAAKFYIVLIDDIGHGKSSKPSDGLHMRFPRYTYDDMIVSEYRVVAEKLKVDHLRLVMGTSMGGMHTWLWGEAHPDFMDALMPLASLPVQIAGRNRMMRKMYMDSIRNDPEWNNGEYTKQPRGLADAIHILLIMGSSPLQMAEGSAGPRQRRQVPRGPRRAPDEGGRRERLPVSDRFVTRLQPATETRDDQGAVARHQLGRRPDQSAGTGHPGARDQECAARARRRDSNRRRDAWPQHTHLGGGVEELPR